MKTAEEVFTSGLVESDLKPVLGEYLEYNGKYYSLTGERIPYMRDKTLDNRFFILTLFGIGKELERRTQPQKDTIYQVELPVGLPPKHYGALFEKIRTKSENVFLLRISVRMQRDMKFCTRCRKRVAGDCYGCRKEKSVCDDDRIP